MFMVRFEVDVALVFFRFGGQLSFLSDIVNVY